MDNQNHIILGEIKKIAERLIHESHQSDDKTYWETLTFSDELNDYVYQVSETIYSGNAGILLFFIDLYTYTYDEKYLLIIHQICKWLINHCQLNATKNYAFYTGRIGVAYALVNAGELTGENLYIKMAIDIVKDCENFTTYEGYNYDVLSGAAGAIIGLMHIHKASKDEMILTKIDFFLNDLLNTMNFSMDEGIHWFRNPNMIRDLNGLSHGATGMTFLFLEVGRYFRNETYYSLGRQSLLYENKYFNKEMSNWLDFRKIKTRDEIKKDLISFVDNPISNDIFSEANFVAWCHGATGIGLSRTRGHQILREEDFFWGIKAANECISRKILTGNSDDTFTLCHGLLGDALSLHISNLYLQIVGVCEVIDKIKNQVITFIKENKFYISGYPKAKVNDRSLFMGDAGIAYALLRLTVETEKENILLPHLGSSVSILPDINRFPAISISNSKANFKILKKNFPFSVELLGNNLDNQFINSSDLGNYNFGLNLIKYLKNIGNKFPHLGEIIEIELEFNRKKQKEYYKIFLNSLRNALYLERLGIVFTPKMEVNLELSENIYLFTCEFDIFKTCTKSKSFGIIQSTVLFTEYQELDQFSYSLLLLLYKKKRLATARKEFTETWKKKGENKDELTEYFNLQIIEAVKANILILSN